MSQARDLYQDWGAAAKVSALEDTHPALRGRKTAPAIPAIPSEAVPVPAAAAIATGGVPIDLVAVLRACQALSSETNLQRLHIRVREVLSATTGATNVRIVLRRDEPHGWFVPSADLAGSDGTGRFGGLGASLDSPEGASLVPLLAFRYAERTLKPVLVADIASDDRFTIDPYLRRHHCRSLLVMPILSHGVPHAMLILENNLSGGAFTEVRLDSVRLIAGQLAVSLENAMLYEELEERVRERTEMLRATQDEMVSMARQVGMSEIVANVLHDIGDALMAVNVSAVVAARRIHRIHTSQVGTLTTSAGTPREYSSPLSAEHQDIAEELERLLINVDHIIDIMAIQQSHASATSPPNPWPSWR